MHKLESVRENETRKIFWDFEMKKRLSNPGQKARPSANKTKTKRKTQKAKEQTR